MLYLEGSATWRLLDMGIAAKAGVLRRFIPLAHQLGTNSALWPN